MKTIEKKGFGHLLFQALFMSVLYLLSACSDDGRQDVTNVPEDWIQGLPESVSFKVNGGEQDLTFTLAEGVDASQIAYIMSKDAEPWCNISIGNNSLNIKVTPYGYSRLANVTLIYGKNHTKTVRVLQVSDFSDYFTNEICSELKAGITEQEINSIPNEVIRQLAMELKDGSYETEFRVASYRPYQHPEVMAKKNKTAKYSLRDNPTGIWVEKGESVHLMVGKLYEGAEISLMFQGLDGGYGNSKTVPVVEGFNKVIAPLEGLVYVMNHVQDDIPLVLETEEAKQTAAAKTVNIHFVEGKVNGYFDIQKNTEADWIPMLEKADYKYIDVLGKYAHITWEAEQFRKYNELIGYRNITDIIDRYDNLVYHEQEFAGLVKYDRMFNNRLHFCNDQTASSPNASDYRTVYPAQYKPGDSNPFYGGEMFLDASTWPKRLWGPAHEAGHVNQLRPGAKWSGITEVTNNIYCLYEQEQAGAPCKLQSDKINCEDENGKKLGNKIIYDAAIELIVEGNRAHSLPGIKNITRESQLVPFWQLKLYLVDVLGQTDFYKDLYEQFRNHPSPSEKGANGGMDQLDFVRQACKIANLDLTDFFEKWGFLRAVNASLNDYSIKSFIITQNDVDALKEEIKAAGYPKPEHDDIHLITNNTIDDYRN